VVFSGTMDEVNDYAKKQGYKWRKDSKMLFKGYWDNPGGDSYLIT